MKTGWICYNAYTKIESTLKCISRLSDALQNKGYDVSVVKHTDIKLGFGGSGNIEAFENFKKPDFCVYWDKDAQIAHILHKYGVRLFNLPDTMEICDHKGKTFYELSNCGIPMPKTIISPLVYPINKESDDSFARYVADILNFPLVVKECYGSFGSQVHLAHDFGQLSDLRKSLLHKAHLYQEFVEESCGKDLRVITIGGQAICAMTRKNDLDFRANIELGGQGEAYPLTDEIKALCAKISKILNADYFGADFLFGKEGLVLCEINTSAHFLGIEEVTGVDIADAYATWIKEVVGE